MEIVSLIYAIQNKDLMNKICNDNMRNNIYSRLFKYQYGYIKDEYLIPSLKFLEKEYDHLFDNFIPKIIRDAIYFLIFFIDTLKSGEGEKDILKDFIYFDKETLVNIIKDNDIDYGSILITTWLRLKIY